MASGLERMTEANLKAIESLTKKLTAEEVNKFAKILNMAAQLDWDDAMVDRWAGRDGFRRDLGMLMKHATQNKEALLASRDDYGPDGRVRGLLRR